MTEHSDASNGQTPPASPSVAAPDGDGESVPRRAAAAHVEPDFGQFEAVWGLAGAALDGGASGRTEANAAVGGDTAVGGGAAAAGAQTWDGPVGGSSGAPDVSGDGEEPADRHGAPADGGSDPVATLARGGELSLEHRAVEAVVLCAVEPVPTGLLAELLELSPARVDQVCEELAADYRGQRRGFVLARVAGGYRYQTDPELAVFVERFAMEGVSTRLSSAALETLAIVAYKQPVSRAQVAALRGVNVDGVVRLLNQRGLIAEVGHAPGPGQPVLYGTTPAFLEKLGLDSVDQLPAVEDLFPGPEVVEVLEARLRPGTEGP